MQIGGLNLFQALTDKMRWHQERQGVLSENVANADTPATSSATSRPSSSARS